MRDTATFFTGLKSLSTTTPEIDTLSLGKAIDNTASVDRIIVIVFLIMNY